MRLPPGSSTGRYPYTLPVVSWLSRQAEGLHWPPGVTFVVGENGSGKSTLVEALAVAAGINAEGGSQNFRFASRSSESVLGEMLILNRTAPKPRSRFFLRAESYYNVSTEIERLDKIGNEPLLPVYGGVSPHERSHGESFLDLLTHRFRPRGLYILDEPEAALSVRGCMTALGKLAELAAQDCQIVVATHSPILCALPGATILEIDSSGAVGKTSYDDALPVRLTREFLNHPDRYIRHLID